MANEAITLLESKRLIDLESTINAGHKTFVEVGNALAEIRDSKLYRADFKTFEDYCRGKWGWNRAYSGAIDLGTAPRSIADILHRNDDVMEANLQMAAIRQLVSIALFNQNYTVSYGLAKIVHQEFSKELDTIVTLVREFRPGRKGWIVGTLAFCLSADKKSIEFIQKFCSGEDIKSGDPAKTLRDWLLNRSSKHLMKSWRKGAVECICNAAYNAVHGRQITTIKSGSNGIDYFLGKKRGFIDAMKEQMKQQM